MKIIQIFKTIVPISETDCENLEGIFHSLTLNKGDYWIEAGQKNNNIAFIEEGYLRKFYVKDGKEITDYFYFENDFSSDLPSIIEHAEPSASIIAMQRSTLIIFSYRDFNELCKQSPALEHLFRVILERTFIRFYKRTESFILQTPKERYNDLMASYPNVFQRAAQYHIASYLGISPQHLSRLRRKNEIS